MPRLTAIRWKLLEAIFLKDGFKFLRQEGSHRAYGKDGCIRTVIIPMYDEVGIDIIKANMKTANMSRERYFELLKQCQ